MAIEIAGIPFHPVSAVMEANARGDQGPTWQQAVQWVAETPVARGDCLTMTTAHDTYGLSFRIQNAATRDEAAGGELMPLQVCRPTDQTLQWLFLLPRGFTIKAWA